MVLVIGNRDERERQGVGCKLRDDRRGVLVGEDPNDHVLRTVIGEERRQRMGSFDVMRSVQPCLDPAGQGAIGQ